MVKMKGVEDKIWVFGFDDETTRRFYNIFMDMENDPFIQVIPIIVSSYGGSLDNLEAMRDLIKSSDKPVSVTATGKAMSAGLALLAAGSPGLRFVAPGTTLMLHEAAGGAWGKVEEIKSQSTMIEISNERFLANMAKDMGKSAAWLKKEISKRNNSDWFMTAEEAVSLGIADVVGIPRAHIPPPEQVLVVRPEEVVKRAKKNLATNKKKR